VVAFKAFYSQDGEEHVMNEISRFTKINGRWFYLDGVIKSMGKVDLQTNQGKNVASFIPRFALFAITDLIKQEKAIPLPV